MTKSFSGTEIIKFLFRSLLSRDPSRNELASLENELTGASGLDHIAGRLIASPEFKGLGPSSLFVPPGHFYSPVVDVDAVLPGLAAARAREITPAQGIDMRHDSMVDLWGQLKRFMNASPFPRTKGNGFRYYYENPAYSWADGLVLHSMLQHFRPRRLIEVGSGFSSACALDTIDAAGLDTEVTFVEPYPELLYSLMRPADRDRTRVIPTTVQSVDFGVFETLEANDILFIDSTHVVKTGSDVTFEVLELLPRLKPGVIIHFHDIFYPFEYPDGWVKEGRSWTENYLLRAFLMFNTEFEILFFNDYFFRKERKLINETVPEFLNNSGGAFWMRRK